MQGARCVVENQRRLAQQGRYRQLALSPMAPKYAKVMGDSLTIIWGHGERNGEGAKVAGIGGSGSGQGWNVKMQWAILDASPPALRTRSALGAWLAPDVARRRSTFTRRLLELPHQAAPLQPHRGCDC